MYTPVSPPIPSWAFPHWKIPGPLPLSLECLPHCVTGTWRPAHRLTLRLFKHSLKYQPPPPVQVRESNEQLPPLRPAPGASQLQQISGASWDGLGMRTLRISHICKPLGHAWELILGVGARPSCWQDSGNIMDMCVPAHVWS